MCCEPSGYDENQINGECPDCGEPTVDGDAFYYCGYEPQDDDDCHTCGTKYCTGYC